MSKFILRQDEEWEMIELNDRASPPFDGFAGCDEYGNADGLPFLEMTVLFHEFDFKALEAFKGETWTDDKGREWTTIKRRQLISPFKHVGDYNKRNK